MQVFFKLSIKLFLQTLACKVFFHFYFNPCSFKILYFHIKFYFIHILISQFERKS
jgi:hypothetical protein